MKGMVSTDELLAVWSRIWTAKLRAEGCICDLALHPGFDGEDEERASGIARLVVGATTQAAFEAGLIGSGPSPLPKGGWPTVNWLEAVPGTLTGVDVRAHVATLKDFGILVIEAADNERREWMLRALWIRLMEEGLKRGMTALILPVGAAPRGEQ